MVRIHSPRPTFSNTYSRMIKTSGSKKGPFLDPTLTRTPHSVGRCHCVLIDLHFSDCEDILGPYQEV